MQKLETYKIQHEHIQLKQRLGSFLFVLSELEVLFFFAQNVTFSGSGHVSAHCADSPRRHGNVMQTMWFQMERNLWPWRLQN